MYTYTGQYYLERLRPRKAARATMNGVPGWTICVVWLRSIDAIRIATLVSNHLVTIF